MTEQQLSLYESTSPDVVDATEWGTFKDSLRSPIHRWFTYPAGFSYRAVQASLHANGVPKGAVIYDPFMGSGTTNLTAKKLGYSSYGVEAHPFVFQIAEAKLTWDIDSEQAHAALVELEAHVRRLRAKVEPDLTPVLASEFPELVVKCYEPRTLRDLMLIRDALKGLQTTAEIRNLFSVGLTSILRQVSLAETGWPYIAPKKHKTSSLSKDAVSEFRRQVHHMIQDLEVTRREADPGYPSTVHAIFNGDARNTLGQIPDAAADHVFTSPPYLNNFDYADRTRLELYFWGEAKSWGDISQSVRTRLITSATTQIARDDPKYKLSSELGHDAPAVHQFLSSATAQLSKVRLSKGGKKSYDHLVSGYFNDIHLVVRDVYRVLRRGAKAVFVLGDSAPYGVHIPTDELIGKIGVGVGFANYDIAVLRTRGGKWKDNPQRHDVSLRESIVTLSKD